MDNIKRMVAGSILPVTIHNGKLHFLFGKENDMEDSARGWSDFGGGVETGETPYETAMREGGEELSGFLGDGKVISEHIRKHGGTMNHVNGSYHVHMFYLPYDENLVKYYNQNHDFLWKRMNKQILNDSRLFEKQEIGWFSVEDCKRRKPEFRKFYQEILEEILTKREPLQKFIKKCAKLSSSSKNRKTQRNKK
jgi:8-oxo-dGTP pyrophosphatase MutT (NUDIX family)